MAAPVLTIPTSATFDAALAARVAIKSGLAWWKIEIDTDVDGSYTDYTSYLDNNRVRVEASGSVFASGLATSARFTLRNSPKLFDAGDLAGVPVKISAKVGSSSEYIQVFFGYVGKEGVAREKRGLTDDTITVSVVDPAQSRGITHKADAQTLYVGKYVANTSDAANSLAHILAGKLGLTPATDVDFQVGTALAVTKDYVYIDKDASYWSELQDLALGTTSLLGFRYDGKLRLARWTAADWNDPASAAEYTFDDSNVHSFAAVGSDVLCNRAKIEWERWQALDAGQIAKCMESWNESTARNAITIAAGEYWPGGTDEYAVARLSYERSGEKFPIGVSVSTPVIAKNLTHRRSTADIQYSGAGTLTLESFNGTAGTDSTKTTQHADASEIILKNTGASPVVVFQMRLQGTPVRVLSKNIIQNKIASLDDWEYVDKELPGKYIPSRAKGEQTCQRWTSFGQVARERYQADCDFTPHLQPGAIVVFNPTADVSMYALVEGYEHVSEGPHTRTRTRVTLLEVADFTESDGDSDMMTTTPVFRTAGAGLISGTDIDALALSGDHFAFGSDGSAAVYDGWETLPTGAELFDLRQPDCRSHLGRSPAVRETVYEPAYIKDELGDDLANTWSKWSGLGAVGCFAAVTNLVVDPEDMSTSSWAESAVDAPTDSGYTLRGRKLWTIQNSGAAEGYSYQEITVTAAVHSIQAVIHKGTTDAPTLRAYDGATKRCQVDVDFSGATPTATASTGTLAFAKAIGTDAILVGAITTAFAGTTMSLRVYVGSASDNANVYATAFQVELRAYPTPYTPTSRAIGSIRYALSPASSGTIDVWVRPLFTYDATGDKYLWRLGGSSGNNHVSLLYDATTDKWCAWIAVGASDYRYVRSTTAFTTNAALWAWQHLKVVWDCANDELALYVNGVAQTSTASAGSVATIAFAGNNLYVGGLVTGYSCQSFMADLCYQASTEDTTTTHYDGEMPWRDSAEVANAVQSVRINQSGIRVHGGEISITDDRNRLISISNRDGLFARDAAGTTIHDIPTAPILSDMRYGGHAIFLDAPDYFDSVTLAVSNTDADAADVSSTQNADLSSYVGSLDNVRGAILSIYLYTELADGKAAVGTLYGSAVRYAVTYNTTPGDYNFIARHQSKATVASVAHLLKTQHFAIVPVVWDSGVPYITWNVALDFASMAANSDVYGATVYLFLLGLTV